MPKLSKTIGLVAASLVGISGVTGCTLSGMTGQVLSGYAVDHLTPHLIASGDLGMACEVGQSLGPFLLSFERVTSPPKRAAISTFVAAAVCAEELAWEAELTGLRALHQGRPSEAQDARILEKRHHAVASDRYHRAYLATVEAFGEPGDTCPKLDEKAELLWVLGMLAAVQGVQHDRASGAQVGIPLDIPRKAVRGAACLDDDRWWGVPQSLKAAVALSLPGSDLAGEAAWEHLDGATQKGRRAGVRLAEAIRLQAAATTGANARVRESLLGFASDQTFARSEEFGLLDVIARRQVLAISDVIWTEAEGHRTPIGGLGTLPSDSEAKSEEDTLLEDL